MIDLIRDERIRKILWLPGDEDEGWRIDLERFEREDVSLTRKSAGESSIKSIQRLLIFLGYSTASTGAFVIDGDFGRGTNRGVAQFQFENGLNTRMTRDTLCYDCTWQSARPNIVAIPDVRLTVKTLQAMLEAALRAIDSNDVMCGSFDEALFHLNSLHRNSLFSCKQILQRCGGLVEQAVRRLRDERAVSIQPEWILAIIKQETGGVVRPRFEQHLLTRLNRNEPRSDFGELRFRSMSFGLGQILGENYRRVGSPSAHAMFTSLLDEQVLFVARYLAVKGDTVAKKNPSEEDFRTIAKYYNGPAYASHHYHESIASWFKEFRAIL